MCIRKGRCGTAFHGQAWEKQPRERLRSSCLEILCALKPSGEIVGSVASGSRAFCVGLGPLPGPFFSRQLGLEVLRSRIVPES